MESRKVKFADLSLDDPFLYNGLLYSKMNESEGFNQRLGNFTIHPDEIVNTLPKVVSSKKSKFKMKPVVRFAVFWGVAMFIIYCIGEFCL